MNEQLAASPEDTRWSALAARDRAADGTFVYAVRTTGVYCRPSCAARPARPENVRFFATGQEAEAAGFRPSCFQSLLKAHHCFASGLLAPDKNGIHRKARLFPLVEQDGQAGDQGKGGQQIKPGCPVNRCTLQLNILGR